MSKEIDYDEAERLLRDTWQEVTGSNAGPYVDEYILQQGLKQILAADKYGTRTFKYILVTNVLAKTVNPDVHALALKDNSNLDGSFNSGGLATDVVTDWEKDNGERLGGSNEPRTNSVYYRQAELNTDYEAWDDDLYQTLIRILTELEERSSEGKLEPINMLRQTMHVVSQLEPTTVSYMNPPDVSYIDLNEAVEQYLEKSGTGERLAAVAAGVLDAQYFVGDRTDYYIKVDHVNVADENSSAAGDIEIFKSEDEDTLIQAIEVKDKPATKADIQHSISTGREHELDEYMFITGRGFQSIDERERAMDAISDAEIELVVVTKIDLLSSLKFQGRAGRTRFRESVGEFLNDMRAQEGSKSDWKQMIESL
ncbi:restriction endonuclease, SacI family [Natronorubrum halophilum]|uniref:restriction endonuclease, SacI family n=1 Tax=Natronorubrum halophilum TaxID=1702106 RepID=UPI00148558BD|nr:restriction endonuclease, SacI family [Natronorubrum halophilum]